MHPGGMSAFIRSADEKPAKITRQLLLRVLSYARPYWGHMALMLGGIMVGTGLSLASPLIFRRLIDSVLPAKDLRQLVIYSILLLFIPIMDGGVGVFQRRLNAVIGEGVIFALRVSLFNRLQRMSLRFFTNTKIGELMSRLNNDVVGAQNAISNTIVSIITNLIQTIAFLAVMLSLQWQLTLLTVSIMPLFIVAARRSGERLRGTARQSMELNAMMNAHMNETLNIGGALLVKLFGRSADEELRFQKRAAGVRDIGVQRAVISTTFIVIMGLVSAVGTALVYGLGGYYVIRGAFTVGTIVAFGSYLGLLYRALQGLAGAPVEFSTSMVSFERVFEILDLPLDIAEKEGALVLRDVRGDLEFDHVSFSYSNADVAGLSHVRRYGKIEDVAAVLSGQPAKSGQVLAAQPNKGAVEESEDEASQAREVALRELTFHAAPGQLVALVGPSGAGKTTATYLIPRLYDPSGGAVRMDGHDLRDVSLDSLSAQIGMVTQENYLFHDTILTNITYARPDAAFEEIEAAARAANIHDFIMALPEGYNTVVGERGYRLSGGEKQRISLARVILKNPRILILDEATSSLDSESEALIQDALKRVMSGRTSIVIAHRLSTILSADMILVMDKGRIVERGRHEDLLAQGGLYHQLFETQFKHGTLS